MKKIIIYILVIVVLTSCRRERTIVFEGRMMQACGVPAANNEGSIQTFGSSFPSYKPGLNINFVTDSMGYFRKVYETDEGFSRFKVYSSAKEVLYVHNNTDDHKKLGDLHISFPINFIIKLDVKETYTANDTLVMREFDNNNLFSEKLYPGPFENGILDSVINYEYDNYPIDWLKLKNGEPQEYSLAYHFRDENGWDGYSRSEDFEIAPICSEEFAEVTLVIE